MIFLKKTDEKLLANQRLVKETNIKQIFDLIYSHGKISRIDLAKITNLSRATVSILVEELLDVGLVNTIGEGNSNSAGRKPIILEVNKDRAQFITLAFKKDRFYYVLSDLLGNPLESFSEDIKYKKNSYKEIFRLIKERTKKLDSEKLLAVCISVPATVNSVTKEMQSSVLDVEDDYGLLTGLENELTNIPIIVGNQSAVLAYAEYKYTDNNEVKDSIFINIDEGIGAGIIMDGKVFIGSSGHAGEIGHMSIDENGPKCLCGRRGCIERYINKYAIFDAYKKVVEKGEGLLPILCEGDLSNLNYEMIRKAIENNDKKSVEIAEYLADKLAFSISNIISIFNPEEIVIGGGIEEIGNCFLEMVKKQIKVAGSKGKCAENNVNIKYTCLNNNIENRGMVRYFIDNIFKITVETDNCIYYW